MPRLAAIVVLAVPATAVADPPTKQQCVSANEEAQALRQRESLKAARDTFATCTADSCPGPVREDCAERIREIEQVMPSLVFEVKDESGRDLTEVTLEIDGELVSRVLGGAAVEVNPGAHELTFVAPNGPPVTQNVAVHEGQKARVIAVTIPARGEGSAAVTSRHRSPLPVIGLGVAGGGAAGLAVGAVLAAVARSTYDSAVSGPCRGSASHCNATGVSQISSAHAQAAGSTAAFLVGGALLAGGVTLWLGTRNVSVASTNGGATIALGASF